MKTFFALSLAFALAIPAYAKPPPKAPAQSSAKAPHEPYAVLPAQLKTKYLKMSFKGDGGEPVQISLEKLQYQNPHYDAVDRGKLKDRMMALVNADLGKGKDRTAIDALTAPYTLKTWDHIFQFVFTGEGTPEEIQVVLKLASKYKDKLGRGVLKKKPQPVEGAFWHDKGSLSASVQDFYWSNIGLNCNGFVGSYARAVGTSQSPRTTILAYAPPGRRIKDLDNVRPGDVIVWKDGKHIVAIQGKRSDGKFDAVESAGTPVIQGLGSSIYEFKKAGPDLWTATPMSPSGKKGNPTPVYIASLK